MKSKRFSRLLNILIKVLTIIILASLFGVKYIGLFSTKANAEDGWFSFNNLFDNNPIFNLVGAATQQDWLDLDLRLTAEQAGNNVTLTATINTSLPTEANKKYYWYFSDNGGGDFYNCIGEDIFTTTNTYEATFSAGRIYKVEVLTEVKNSYSLIWDAYDRFFSRPVDQDGLDTWGTTLTQHTLINKFADLTGVTPVNEISALSFAMVISVEYLTNNPWNDENAKALIAKLYRFALGREASQNEINSWFTNTYKTTSGTTNVPIDVYYTIPNGVFAVINGICGSAEAGNKHENRYYYNKSTGKYTYATATLTNTTVYLNQDTVRPSKLNINPNGGTMDVESPMGKTAQNISSTTAYKQFAESKLKITNAEKTSTITTTQYTVSYNGNNGTVGTLNSGNTSSTTTETIAYSLSGWTKNPDPLNGSINSSNIYTFPSEKEKTDTITAVWKTLEPTIERTEVILPSATRTGYILDGWYTDATGGDKIGVPGEGYTPEQDITLYAQWKPNLTVNPNGGTVTVRSPSSEASTTISTSQTYTQDCNTTLTLGNPIKMNDLNTVTYTISYNGNSGTVGTTTNANTKSLRVDTTTYEFSNWIKSNPFYGTLSTDNSTYTFPSNNGTTSTLSANYISQIETGTQGAITLPTATRTGYTLNGWYTASTGGVMRGNAGDTYTPSSNETLYAHWTSNDVVITIKKDNANWNDNIGINVALYKNGSPTSYTNNNATKSEANVSWSSVTEGTYDIYASKSTSGLNVLVDTGVDVVVTSSGTATIDYYTLTLQVGVGISSVIGGGTYLNNQDANIDATVMDGYTWQGWSVILGNTPD